MAVNKHIPHLYVIPEDDANRQMAVGFEKDYRVRGNAFQVVAPAGGWRKAIDKLKTQYFELLELNVKSHVLVLIDCEGDADRISNAMAEVPIQIKDRVFIIGTLSEPEVLKASLKTPIEKIGEMVVEDCFDSTHKIWMHDQLKHNAPEVSRLKTTLFKIVFQD